MADAAATDTPTTLAEIFNETSPLLNSENQPPERQKDGNDQILAPDQDAVYQAPKSIMHLLLLCLGIAGLQMAWATELSNGSPYLLSLGMQKSLLAIVWIAGPLSGVLVQPIVGILSDNCQIAWGRRRPFMLGGAAATVLSLLALAWAREIVGALAAFFGTHPQNEKAIQGTIAFAILWIYLLDFAVNTLQASIRAFIVDNTPAHQQDEAHAWASRLMGLASIFGYLLGWADLPRAFPFLGDTQFKVLCVISSLVLIINVGVSCFLVPEYDPRTRWPTTTSTRNRVIAFLASSLTSFNRLTPQTQKVCAVQFFNWIGWFPFLFYTTTYIGQLYVDPIFRENPSLSDDDVNKAWEEATRLGAFALLTFATTSFLANILLPLVVQPILAMSPAQRRVGSQSRFKKYLCRLRIRGLTIRRTWFLAHILFAFCMFSTFFINGPIAGAAMTGFAGLSWAMTLWAPFALISADISKRDAFRRYSERAALVSGDHTDTQLAVENISPAVAVIGAKEDEVEEDQAGVVLGLHNVAISAPQIVATVVASLIFRMRQLERGVAGDDSVGWVLRVGGLASLVAAWMTLRISEESQDETAFAVGFESHGNDESNDRSTHSRV